MTAFAANIQRNWVQSPSTTFFKKQVAARGAYIGLSALTLAVASIGACVKLGAGTLNILSAGKYPSLHNFTIRLNPFNLLLADPYSHFISAFNLHHFTEEACISFRGNGLFPEIIRKPFTKPLNEHLNTCLGSDIFFKRHVSSRLTILLLGVALATARVADAILAVPVTLLSLVTLGTIPSVNNLAYRTLQAPAIISDLLHCTVKFINPFAGIISKPVQTQ